MQLFDEERRLRTLAEQQVRAYSRLLEDLARKLAPETVEEHRRQDPSFFQRLTIDGWQAFFLTIQSGDDGMGFLWRRVDSSHLPQLMQQIAALRAKNELLQHELAELRQETLPAQGATNAQASLPSLVADPIPVMAVSSLSNGNKPTIVVTLPDRPPTQFASCFRNWQREGLTLAILAQTGWSLRHAIAQELSLHIGISAKAGSLKRMFTQMAENDLWRMETLGIGRNLAAIVTLTDLGKQVVHNLGLTPVLSEWERLLIDHGGERQNDHAALVCSFTHQARQRGFGIQVCPPVNGPAAPDVMLTYDGEQIYVEVEAESGDAERRMKKWRNQAELQGYVALCAVTPEARHRLVVEAKGAAKHGKATDISTLLREDGMWLDEW
jgi:hypothetical protein